MPALFIDRDNREYGSEEIYKALIESGARECDTLFIHSDLSFGKIAVTTKRNELLSSLYDILKCLGVKNLIVPSFTYSFCNNEIYDVNKSRTYMGALNEFIRKVEGRYRTMDPLLSLSVPQNLKNNFEKLSNHSLGENSGLDIVHKLNNVRFLFFGASLGNCFTYVHYIEKMLNVEYRFDISFSGKIIDYDGNIAEHTQYMHTACYGVKPADFYYFEDELENNGFLKKIRLGNSYISSISETVAYREISSKIKKDINYFLEKPYTKEDLIHKYTKGIDGRKITHC